MHQAFRLDWLRQCSRSLPVRQCNLPTLESRRLYSNTQLAIYFYQVIIDNENYTSPRLRNMAAYSYSSGSRTNLQHKRIASYLFFFFPRAISKGNALIKEVQSSYHHSNTVLANYLKSFFLFYAPSVQVCKKACFLFLFFCVDTPLC